MLPIFCGICSISFWMLIIGAYLRYCKWERLFRPQYWLCKCIQCMQLYTPFQSRIYFHWSFYTQLPREEQMLFLFNMKQHFWEKLHMCVHLPALQQLMSCQLPQRQMVKTHQKLFNPVRARHMQSVRNQSVSKRIKLAYHIKPHLHSSAWPYITPDIRTAL